MGKHEATASQVTHPSRAVIRTVFQALVGLCALAPVVYTAASQQDPAVATGAAAGVLAITGAVTRIMALPGVDAWLRIYVPWLAATPAETQQPATSEPEAS